jgi:hypothetical protein
MKTLVSMIVVAALAAVGMVDAKPVEHPVMHPIAYPTNPELEKPKFEHKKHHVRPHRHGKRHHRCHHHKMCMNDAPIIRPVRELLRG